MKLPLSGNQTNYYSNLTPTPEATPTPVPEGTHISGVIVLLTDGENNENPDPLEAAQAAADRGVRIYTVGIGSPQGTDLHINGFTVHTQLDEATLQQISQITGGTYYNADSEQDLLNIYDNLNPELIIKPEMLEVTPLFAGREHPRAAARRHRFAGRGLVACHSVFEALNGHTLAWISDSCCCSFRC